MLFIIIALVCLAVGIVATVLYKCGPYSWARHEDWAMFTALIGYILAFIIGLTSSICYLEFKTNEPYLIENLKTEYVVIQANIDRINEDKMPYTWSNAIADYNSTVAQHKRYVDNPWLGIFYSKEIAEMEFIDLTQFMGD